MGNIRALERAINFETYTAIEPNYDFLLVLGLFTDGREKPEIQIVLFIGFVADGQEASI